MSSGSGCSGSDRPRPASRLYRVATRFFLPRGFREQFAESMVADFEQLWDARAGCGARARMLLLARAVADVVRVGWRQRRSEGPALALEGPGPLAGLGVDVHVALRSLRRAPAFTFCAVVVLALGLGANGVAWSALRATLLSRPPYPELERLAIVDLTYRGAGGDDRPREGARAGADEVELYPWSYPKFQQLLGALDRPFELLAGFASRTSTLVEGGEAERTKVEIVSPSYFALLGVVPQIGSLPSVDGDTSESLVLSHGLWQSRFGGDPSVVGQRTVLNGHALTVIGVAPRGFEGLTGGARAWITFEAAPLVVHPRALLWPQGHWFYVIGRLRPGIAMAQADAAMAPIGRSIARAVPDEENPEGWGASARSFEAARANPNARRAVLLVTAGALALLFAGCANLAALLVSHAGARVREVAMRQAMGASRWRLVRLMVCETLMLGLLGGVVGALLLPFAVHAAVAGWPESFSSGDAGLAYAGGIDLGIGGLGLLEHLGLAVLAGLAFGLPTALHLSRRAAGSIARAGSRELMPARRFSLRDGLVAAQGATAVVFLVVTALLGQSLWSLRHVPIGFDPDHLLTFHYQLPRDSSFAEHPEIFHRQVLERLSALPGVRSVAFGAAPLGGHEWITRVNQVDGKPEPPPGERRAIGVSMASERLFETLQVPLLAGRGLLATDSAGSAPVMVINEAAARELFPGGPAVGHRLRIGIDMTSERFAEIVGVVGDVLYDHPAQGVMPEAYVSFQQETDVSSTVLIRVQGDPLALQPSVREAIKGLAPDVPIFGARTVEQLGVQALGDTRALAVLIGLFALVVLVLASAGTYGVVASSVARRNRELGIRLALGAKVGQVVRMVLARGLLSAILGVVIGSLIALLVSRVAASFLFEVTARDPATFIVAALGLIAVALLASYLPARRASRLDPAATLRAE